MMRQSFEDLWCDWKGRILLINIANQLLAGVVASEDLRPLFNAVKSRPADFGARDTVMDPGFPVNASDEERNDALHFISTMILAGEDRRLHLRVTSMMQIMQQVSFEDLDGDMHDQIIDELRRGLEPSRTSSDEDNRQVSLTEFQNNLFPEPDSQAIRKDLGLPNAFHGWSFRRAILRRKGIGPKSPSNDPVFIAPLNVSAGVDLLFENAKTSIARADLFRDRLGLDHLGARYVSPSGGGGASHVVLGFILVREDQFQHGPPKRPTPFDDTSKARFRATHGHYPGRVTQTGRTADLGKIAKSGSIDGISEVVVRNQTLRDGEVVIGYLGEVRDPRKDAFSKISTESLRDQSFIKACMGEWTKDDVINTVVSACPKNL